MKEMQRLIDELEKKVEFHRTNTNDPHQIGNAVYVALHEVLSALKNALAAAQREDAT